MGDELNWTRLVECGAIREDDVRVILERFGHQQMTPVQAAAIPLLAVQNKDVVVEAVTGSGKTLAYVLPALTILRRAKAGINGGSEGGEEKDGGVRVLIVAPTRELATQIHTVVEMFSKGDETAGGGEGKTNKIKASLIIGGRRKGGKRREEVDILIGTPGRLHDRLQGDPKFMRHLELLVLDEADRLLEGGFDVAVSALLQAAPKQRRTALLSATMTDAMDGLARTSMRNPVSVVVKCNNGGGKASEKDENDASRIPAGLDCRYALVDIEAKIAYIVRSILTATTTGDSFYGAFSRAGHRIVAYVATCAVAEFYGHILPAALAASSSTSATSAIVSVLHGKLRQSKRDAILAEFSAPCSSKQPLRILVCTDVAARGLDFRGAEVHAVLHVDPPQDPASFVHRCGRSGRAGRAGSALLLLSPLGNEPAYVDLLRRRGVPITALHIEPVQMSAEAVEQVNSAIRRRNASGRDALEASIRAFVSYFRYYSAHRAAFIFDPHQMDALGLARAFGMLRLPRMPELITEATGDAMVAKKGRTGRVAFDMRSFQVPPEAPSDFNSIPFTDPSKELKRLEELTARSSSSKERRKRTGGDLSNAVPWSKTKERKAAKLVRAEKKVRRQVAIAAGKPKGRKDATAGDKTSGNAGKEAAVCENDDQVGMEAVDRELEEDWKEYKRERRGRTSKKPLDSCDSDDSDDNGGGRKGKGKGKKRTATTQRNPDFNPI